MTRVDADQRLRLRAYTARENPFRTERVLSVRYCPLETDWVALMERLAAFGFRAAIFGPEGSGKTTLLEDLAAHFKVAGRSTRWLQLRRETQAAARRLCGQFLDTATPDELLLVDGAEQIGPLTWRHLRRRARRNAGLIITTHRPGRLPTLISCRTTPELLESIVARLVPDDVDILRQNLPALFARHGGNIRLCLRALYDRYALAGASG